MERETGAYLDGFLEEESGNKQSKELSSNPRKSADECSSVEHGEKKQQERSPNPDPRTKD